MNLVSGFEEHPTAFYVVSGGTGKQPSVFLIPHGQSSVFVSGMVYILSVYWSQRNVMSQQKVLVVGIVSSATSLAGVGH
jgi:hypothetical protein